MDIEKILASIKDESLNAVKEEFQNLVKQAFEDKSDLIKTSAEQVIKALGYRVEGKLTEDDVVTLLKKQKKIAQIEANNAQIELLSRIQNITYRILDISIDILLKAIIPI